MYVYSVDYLSFAVQIFLKIFFSELYALNNDASFFLHSIMFIIKFVSVLLIQSKCDLKNNMHVYL